MNEVLRKAVDAHRRDQINDQAVELIERLTALEADLLRLADDGVDIVGMIQKARTGKWIHPSRLPR